jgi:Trk K+ transport system NAD-binding subunit
MVSLPELPSLNGMSYRKRLVLYYITGLVVAVFVFAVIYNVVMSELEGANQSIFASLDFVVQTMTTTGFGQDSDIWSHPITFLFVILTQLTGIGIGFFTLRLIIIPLFTGAEVDLDNRLSPKHDHVIICEYRRDSAVLLDELRELDIDYVLISSDEENAKDLSDDGYSVIHGSPQDASAFERASIDSARAVITDAGTASVNTILTVRSIQEDVEIITLTDDSDMTEILLETGADTVLSPHAVLGHRLAEKAISSLTAELTDTIDLGANFEVTEVPVDHESPLVGTRIRDSKIRERTGANVIGAWIDGELQLPPSPDAVIRTNTVLLVSGAHESLEAFADVTRPVRARQRHERIVVAGYGEVGEAAQSIVEDADIECVTIDVEAGDGVDIVADAATEEALYEAGIETADAILVGVPDDSASLLTTVLARKLNPEIEILSRVSATDATQKALSAGADYVLSVPRVSARMVAKEILGEDVLAPASQIRFVRVPAHPFAGSTLANSGIYERTGCRVIAVEDDAGATTAIDPQRTFTGEERITIVGTDESVQRFLKQFDVSPAPAEA